MPAGGATGYTLTGSGGGGVTVVPAATALPTSMDLPGTQVTLDASASTGTGILTYLWTLHGPNRIETDKLSSATAVAPTFTPAESEYGMWAGEVTVTDTTGSASAVVYVQVAATNRASAAFVASGADSRVGVRASAVDSPIIFTVAT